MSVVLVGNGASLRGSGLGPVIDSHDVVVRMNNFRIYGYENDVGTKRTIHFRAYNMRYPFALCIPPHDNKGCSMLLDDRFEDFDQAVLWPIARTSLSRVPELARYKEWHEAPASVVSESRRICLPMTKNPTSGIMSIVYAMSLWEKIDVCGLDKIRNPDDSLYGYYFCDELFNESVFTRHDFINEHRGMLTYGDRINFL